MPLWVAPSIAAEMWSTSVEQIMQSVTDGRVPSKTDCGFLLVDIDPTGAMAPLPTVKPAPHATQEQPEPITHRDWSRGRANAVHRRIAPPHRIAA